MAGRGVAERAGDLRQSVTLAWAGRSPVRRGIGGGAATRRVGTG
jgi:hypothetical protein